VDPPASDLVLTTPRLTLRELARDDLDFVAEMLADAEVMRFYPKRYTREEAEGWLNRQLERYRTDGHGLWLVSERATGVPVGQVGLLYQAIDGVREPEVGYLVHRPYWRRGYATEAALAVRDLARQRWDHRRVVSIIRPENIPSQGVARKMGMAVERHTLWAGMDHLLFSVTLD